LRIQIRKNRSLNLNHVFRLKLNVKGLNTVLVLCIAKPALIRSPFEYVTLFFLRIEGEIYLRCIRLVS